jgi:fructose-6-phosphate aldolase 1
MIELYLDAADLEQVARFNSCLPLKGVTTNPSIVAASGMGLRQLLSELSDILGKDARFHAQVISDNAGAMVAEAEGIMALPYDMVVKVPATEIGLNAIKQMKRQDIPVLATAIYSAQQGFMAALCGADYLAPYVNRIDTLAGDGIGVVADLQNLLNDYQMQSKILAASFKSSHQALAIMKLGVGAITLPVDVARQMLQHPAVSLAVDQFSKDWQKAFGDSLSYDS